MVTDNGSVKTDRSSEMNMQADTVDQLNINHQSNMTLSANSVITQSHYRVRIAYNFEEEENGGHE